MIRILVACLIALVLAQSSLAAADAHVLHDAAGEAGHHHSQPADHGAEHTADHATGHDVKASAATDTDNSAEHMCHHCCHGHSIKSLAQSNLTIAVVRDEFQVTHSTNFPSLVLTPDSPPPIV